MDTGLRNWALTLGSALAVGAIATGYGHIVVAVVTAAGDIVWWLVQPIGPL